MATRAQVKRFGLVEDENALRQASRVVRRRGWEPKFSRALVRLADEIKAEIAAMDGAAHSVQGDAS